MKYGQKVFAHKVVNLAEICGWTTFHFPDRIREFAYAHGRGFPECAMYKEDQNGEIDFLFAELRMDSGKDSKFVELHHDKWLAALRSRGVEIQVWRPSDIGEIEARLGPIPQGKPSPFRSGDEPFNDDIRQSLLYKEVKDAVLLLVGKMESPAFDRGSLIDLRRMNPDNPKCGAFWRLVAIPALRKLVDEFSAPKWGLIVNGIAEMIYGSSRRAAHFANREVGTTLFYGGSFAADRKPFYGSKEFDRLMAANGVSFRRFWTRAFKRLGKEGAGFDWVEMAWLILNEGVNPQELANSVQGVFASYYGEEYRSKRNGGQDS